MVFDPVINHVPKLNILQWERFKRRFVKAFISSAKPILLSFFFIPKFKN